MGYDRNFIAKQKEKKDPSLRLIFVTLCIENDSVLQCFVFRCLNYVLKMGEYQLSIDPRFQICIMTQNAIKTFLLSAVV